MRFKTVFATVAAAVFCWLLPGATGWCLDMDDVGTLLDRAEKHLRLGVVDKGAGRSFEEAQRLVATAEERLTEINPPQAEAQALMLELETVREDVEIFSELYEERFYGLFPLARLISQNLSEDEGFVFTEQLYHPPDVAAVNFAIHGILNQIGKYSHPHVVITSRSVDRHLENIVLEALLRDRRSTPIGRRTLVRALSREDLKAFDRGEIDIHLMNNMLNALNLVDLMLVTVDKPAELAGITTRRVSGDYYIRGEVVQGSPVDASPIIRGESFEFFGFARDRRDQLPFIIGTGMFLLTVAMVWAAMTPWGLEKPLRIFYRLFIGVVLFVYGLLFIIIAVALLRKIIPDSTSMANQAMWWPAVLGYCTILTGGLFAWIGQALLTDVIPGARGGRAVGAIFGIVALGTCTYFIMPMLLLDGSLGFVNVIPTVLSCVSLAVVFGLAARTGPPVPHYFMAGPLLIAPLAGSWMLKAVPEQLWALAGICGFLCLVAGVRHRIMVARGMEEKEPSAEEAAQADKEILVRLSKKIMKRD